MSLVAELKRRSVFKVGAGYLVVAWLAAQAAGLAFPAFEAPAWALRVFLFVLMIGFPIALVLAWTFDITPDGVKVDSARGSDTRFFVIVGAIALLALGWYFKGQPSYTKDDPQAQSGPPSVAVLPFANLSGDPTQEYFSDGMTEEILNVLVKIPDLKVAARTSVFEFKGKGGDVREIGKKLGVTYIVEGSIRRDANTMRVTAQMIRVADGFHVWSETYDRELKSVFAIQDEIAQRIGQQLKGSLAANATPAARADVDPQAYDAYLKARTLYRARSNLPLAIAHLHAAVERAPQFAPAWATLALANEVAIWTTDALVQQALGPALPQMREAAAKAAALEPGSAMTLHALGNVARGEGRFIDAEAHYQQSIAADPTYPDVREDLSELLLDLGQDDAALVAARELVRMEPFVMVFWNRIGRVGIAKQDLALADEARDHIFEIGSSRPWAMLYRFEIAVDQGDLAAAAATMEDVHRRFPGQLDEDWALWRWSQRDPAIDDEVARAAVAYNIDYAIYASLRGDVDLFFASLAMKGADHARYNTYAYLLNKGAGKYLADPRAKRMLRERGFEAYWRAKGWPAHCKPILSKSGEKDFECH